ncbi:MAG: ABC transporter substrate-binding protein [Ilumatobacteraceae bacterium]
MPAVRSIRRARGRGCALGVTVLVVSACTGGGGELLAPTTSVGVTTTTIAERSNDGTLVLGIFLPTTGAGSDLGVPMIAAVDDAVDQINAAGGVLGRDVLVERADEGAGTGPGELLAKGVDAIIGPASSLTALSQLGAAIDPITGVVTCSPSATSLALDDFPDSGGLLFRTAPSDSLQMAVIARRVERTGATQVAVGYLDDPYGRGLNDSFRAAIEARDIEVLQEVAFSGDQADLSTMAERLLDGMPGAIVVLGDADDGGRLLAALDAAQPNPPPIVVNDSIRQARQTIQSLSATFRSQLTGVAPLGRPLDAGTTEGYFTSHAVDCVNLVALAAIDADSDAPKNIRANIANASSGGSQCGTFERCADLLGSGLAIDYDGASGSWALSNASGDPTQARFETFGFDADGNEIDAQAEVIQSSSSTGNR